VNYDGRLTRDRFEHVAAGAGQPHGDTSAMISAEGLAPEIPRGMAASSPPSPLLVRMTEQVCEFVFELEAPRLREDTLEARIDDGAVVITWRQGPAGPAPDRFLPAERLGPMVSVRVPLPAAVNAAAISVRAHRSEPAARAPGGEPARGEPARGEPARGEEDHAPRIVVVAPKRADVLIEQARRAAARGPAA
jgi:hypothetical protein